jgi:hypothetical protein
LRPLGNELRPSIICIAFDDRGLLAVLRHPNNRCVLATPTNLPEADTNQSGTMHRESDPATYPFWTGFR